MDNLAIARVLTEIGDLLEIKNENPFKIRAYRNAAETITHSAERIADLDAGGSARLPGIGKDLAAKITELVDTGTIAYHQRPPRGIPTDDPRPAPSAGRRAENGGAALPRARHQDAGRSRGSAAAQDACVDQGHGREERGADPQGARGTHAVTGRRLLAEAHDAAAALVADASRQRARRDPPPVGSLRRGCETCGDLDILAAGAPPALMEAFTNYRLVERILARGETKSSVLLLGGFQADLRVVARESLGAAMQYFTGSKAHNIALRDRAMQRGLKLNEYGLFASTTTPPSPARPRKASTRRSGLAFIPPELRENRGEIEAAESAPCRGCSRSRTCVAICTCTRPRPTGAPTPRRWRRARAGGRPRATSPSPTTAERWPWPTVSTNGARWPTRARSAR